MIKKEKPKILSLFSGAGGLDLGFRNAGFDICYSVENDKCTFQTYRYNFPKTKHLEDSIVNIKKEHITQKIDGIIGGPPCQSWSEAGAQRGINDPRGKLFYEYVRIIDLFKPKFFLAENVQGLLFTKHSKSFNNIIKKFSNLNYKVDFQLLDAVNFDVPQNRKRVFIIGIRKDIKKDFKFPLGNILKKNLTLKETIWDLRDAIPSKNKNISNGQFLKNNNIQNNEFMTGTFSSIYMSRNRVRSWDEPSYTIQAGGRHAPIHPDAPKMIKIGKDKMKFDKKNKDKYRRLSVRECARIQTFPDDFIFFYEKLSDGYKMVGNAVPVKLAEIIAREIKKLYSN
jgi:DNA (cytosine-5)-methyltransferase 1